MKSFSFRTLFELVLNTTGLKASTFARELGRERSLMYKWLSGSSVPPPYYFPLIAEIVVRKSSQAIAVILDGRLRDCVSRAGLPAEVQESLLEIDSLETLLVECMDISASPLLKNSEYIASYTASYRTRRAQWSLIAWAIFAAVSGGLLWNFINRIAGWQYFMGTHGEALSGVPAFIWGSVTNLMIPLPLFFLFPNRKSKPLVFVIFAFGIVGGLSALLFFSSGIRESVEALRLGYTMQETILVVLFTVCNSVPVIITLILLLKRPFPLQRVLGLILIPAGTTLPSFLLVHIVNRPQTEMLQLRGFVVGLVLRITLFFVLFYSFEQAHSKQAAYS